MLEQVYSLFDRRLREFGPLLVSRNEDAIRRSILDGIRGSGSIMDKYPQDFDLYLVGDFNRETGVIGKTELPKLVENVKEVFNAAG